MEKVIIVNHDAKMDAKQFAYAPLGPLYIAAVLERDGFECELWDLREDYNSYDNPPPGDIYCLTAVTPQIDDMKEVASNIKKKYGDKAYLFPPCKVLVTSCRIKAPMLSLFI